MTIDLDQAIKDTVNRMYNLGVETERERCLGVFNLTPSDIRLAAGEMTAQEMRTVLAVLSFMKDKVRNGP